MNTPDLLGKGIYNITNAARIVHAYPQSVRRWTEGYSYNRRGKFRTSEPVLLTPLLKYDERSVLTFQQLIEILFVRLFISRGVKLPVIKAVAKRCSERFSTAHPFAVRGLQTDGKDIFLMNPSEVEGMTYAAAAENLQHGQMVMPEIVKPYLLSLQYEDVDVARYWPLGNDRRIVLDPARAFGEAIDAQTGVPTRVMYGRYTAGDTIQQIASWYRVDTQAVTDAIAFETQIREKPTLRFAA